MATRKRIARVVLAGSTLVCVFAGAPGCETAGGTALMSEIFSINAGRAGNPRQRGAWQALSNVAAFEAQKQAAVEIRQTPQTIHVKK